ncbi:hypothetical protein M758_UG238900 [Ceratodon purpureus]|nr:hypothetical protein M758_UG238900 [Ceratodon purpureus]
MYKKPNSPTDAPEAKNDGAGKRSSTQSTTAATLTQCFLKPPGTLTFTPLQKWEYKNGFLVDGVEDTREWAIQVGLEAGNEDSDGQRKRIKLSCAVAPPKYAFNGPLIISSPEEGGSSSPKSPAGPHYEEPTFASSRKGKEKEE